MDLRITHTWAEMSEEWVAEETGRRETRRTVRMPTDFTRSADQDQSMEIDLDASALDLRPPSVETPSPTLPAVSYSAAVQKDMRPEIIYEELISTLPERLLPMGLPRSLTNRLKVIVDCEPKVPEPKNPSPVKARLGITPSAPAETAPMEDGEVNSVYSNDSEDESDDEDENNLDSGWCKRLVAPRMKMYADDEAKKQKTQVRALITRSHQGQSYNSRHNSQSTSREELRRVKPYGGGRVEKAYPNVTRRAPVNSRIGRQGAQRRGSEQHDDRAQRLRNEVATRQRFAQAREHRDGRGDRVERNFGSLEYKDENFHRQASQRVPVKDRLGVRR